MADPTEIREALHVLGIDDDLIRETRARLDSIPVEQYRQNAADHRGGGRPYAAAHTLLYAAIFEAELPEPLTVGHLATTDDKTVKVLAIDGDEVWVRLRDGTTDVWLVQYLTPLGPAPEGWPHA